MSEERIYRFVLMQLISFLHIAFDILAFRSDIGFWKVCAWHARACIPCMHTHGVHPADLSAFRSDIGVWKGRETMRGLSSRSVLSSAAQTLVIYLYLLDSDHVNSVVLVTYTVSTALELWKVLKVLRIMRAMKRRAAAAASEAEERAGGGGGGGAAAVALATAAAAAADDDDGDDDGGGGSASAAEGSSVAASTSPVSTGSAASAAASAAAAARLEAATERFDEIATRTLGIGLAPLVGGWAVYALVHYPHTTWYSWVISSLADSVYLFGFISMTPQLFINYQLKSVAHLPWRVMLYKAFNTFVDDVFSVMVSMPMHHRVACLRDDVVFFIFLYQRWLYPTDKTRPNEYGIAYEK